MCGQLYTPVTLPPGERAAGGVLRETTKNQSQITRSPVLDFNRGLHEYKAEIGSIRVCLSILYLAECLTVYILRQCQRCTAAYILYMNIVPVLHPCPP